MVLSIFSRKNRETIIINITYLLIIKMRKTICPINEEGIAKMWQIYIYTILIDCFEQVFGLDG